MLQIFLKLKQLGNIYVIKIPSADYVSIEKQAHFFCHKVCNQLCLTGNGNHSGGTNVTQGLYSKGDYT
jgi:hypothetical protein